MNTINLLKFVTENNVEYHWYDNDVILFIDNYYIDKWNKLIGKRILSDDGLNCVMKDGYFCFKMKEICEYFDIELLDIFDVNN